MGLLIERWEDSGWRLVGTLTPDEQPGSYATLRPDGGRDMLVFTCCGGYSTIQRSMFGVDEQVGPVTRVVSSAGMEMLARLLPGQHYEMLLRGENGVSWKIRWTHKADQ